MSDPEAYARVRVALDANPENLAEKLEKANADSLSYRKRLVGYVEEAADDVGLRARDAMDALRTIDRITEEANAEDERQANELLSTVGRLKRSRRKTGNGLEALLDTWRKRASPTDLSFGEAEISVRRFVEVCGDIPITDITKAHVRDFRAVLERIPRRIPRRIPNKQRALPITVIAEKTEQDGSVQLISSATIRKQIGFIRTLLGVAENDGLIDVNPAQGIRIVDDRAEKARLPFDEQHLRQIFASLPTNDPTLFWMVCLAYTTGARMGEIAALTVDNVRTEDGVQFFDVLDGKTVNARRRIPLHPILDEIGFPVYLKTRKGPLTDHRPDTKNRLTGYFQKNFGRWLRGKAKVEDTTRTFHSFRHGFRDLALSAGVDEVLIERLHGWAPATTGRGYGTGASLPRLRDAVNSIRFPVTPPPWP